MQHRTPVPQQLCFFIGRPLAVLVEEIQNHAQNPELIQAAEQMRQALQTFTLANQNSASIPVTAREALYELLTK